MKRKDIKIAVAVLLLLSLSSTANAQQVEHPDYIKALGFEGNVKSIGVFTEDDAADMYNYCTYEFDNSGRLISYSEAEMIEGAYIWTVFFDTDGRI